jgi:hypothetical protein
MNATNAALRVILLVAGALAILRAGMRVQRLYSSAPAADPGFPRVTFKPLGGALDAPAPDGSSLPFGQLPSSIAAALASGLALDEMRCMLESFSAAVPDSDVGLVLLVTEPPAGWQQLVAREPRVHFVRYSVGEREAAGAVYVQRHLVLRAFLAQLRGTLRVIVFDGRDTVFQSSPFKDPRWPAESDEQVRRRRGCGRSRPLPAPPAAPPPAWPAPAAGVRALAAAASPAGRPSTCVARAGRRCACCSRPRAGLWATASSTGAGWPVATAAERPKSTRRAAR